MVLIMSKTSSKLISLRIFYVAVITVIMAAIAPSSYAATLNICYKDNTELDFDTSRMTNAKAKLTNPAYFGPSGTAAPDSFTFTSLPGVVTAATLNANNCNIMIGGGFHNYQITAAEAAEIVAWTNLDREHMVVGGCDNRQNQICLAFGRSLTQRGNAGVSIVHSHFYNPFTCGSANGVMTYGGIATHLGNQPGDLILATHDTDGLPAALMDDEVDPNFIMTADADMFGNSGNTPIGAGPTATNDQAIFVVNVFKAAADGIMDRLENPQCLDDYNKHSDLAISMDLSDQSPIVGSQITARFTIVNNGPNPIDTSAIGKIVLPSFLSYSSQTGDGSYDSATGEWTTGAIPVGLTQTIYLTLDVTAPGGGTVTAEIIKSPYGDIDSMTSQSFGVDDRADGRPDDDETAMKLRATSDPVDLAISLTPSHASTGLNAPIHFDLSITNEGLAGVATGVVVNAPLPAGYTYTGDDSGGDYNSVTGLWTLTGVMSPGETRTIRIEATMLATGSTAMFAEIQAAIQPDTDSTPGNGDQSPDEDDEAHADITRINQPVFACDSSHYISQGIGGGMWQMYKVMYPPTAGGAATMLPIGVPFKTGINSIGIREQDNFIYGAMVRRGNVHLVRVGSDGSIVDLGRPAGMPAGNTGWYSGDIDSDGYYYIHMGGVIYKIDVTTNTVIATTSVAGAQAGDFAYNPVDGKFYFISGRRVKYWEFTGGASTVTTVSSSNQTISSAGGAYIDQDGILYLYNNSGFIHAADTATGVTTLIATAPTVSSNDGASCRKESVVPLADLDLVKTVDNATPNSGDTIVYTITVTNSGPGKTDDVVVQDNLPAGVAYDSDDGGGAYDNTTGEWTIGAMGVGDIRILKITATVTGTGTITNTAEVIKSTQPDPGSTPGNNEEAEDDQDSADIIVTAYDHGDAPASYGDPTHDVPATPARYMGINPPDTEAALQADDGADEDGVTVAALYAGSNSSAVVITSTPKAYLSAWIDFNSDGDFLDAGEQIATDLRDNGTGDDLAGNDGQIEFNFAVPAGVTTGSNWSRFRFSSVTGLGPDGHGQDGEVEDYELKISDSADLALIKTVDNLTPALGDNVTFTLVVTNEGLTPVTNITVADLLPAGLSYVSHTGIGSFDDTINHWTLPSLAAGSNAAIDITFTVNVSGNLLNRAEIIAMDQNDIDSSPVSGHSNDDYNDGIKDDDESEIAIEVAAGPSPDIKFNWRPNQSSTQSKGAYVTYEHLLDIDPIYDGGTLTFNFSSSQNLTWEIYADNGDGVYSPADALVTGGIGLATQGDNQIYFVTAFLPTSLADGAIDVTEITANVVNGANNDSQKVTDITTIEPDSGIEGGKSLAIDSNCDGDLSDETAANATFETVKAANPGECVFYRITFVNNSTAPVTDIKVSDFTPPYTAYQGGSATYLVMPAGLAAGTIASPAHGSTGNISWQFIGALNPGASGIVEFSVKMEG